MNNEAVRFLFFFHALFSKKRRNKRGKTNSSCFSKHKQCCNRRGDIDVLISGQIRSIHFEEILDRAQTHNATKLLTDSVHSSRGQWLGRRRSIHLDRRSRVSAWAFRTRAVSRRNDDVVIFKNKYLLVLIKKSSV